MTHFITVSNRRGGVGKTTTTSMLAYAFAVLGFQNVLVIDLDAQSSTSITLLGHDRWKAARRDGRTISDLLQKALANGDADAPSYAAEHAGDVHITPGNRPPQLAVLPGSFDLDDTERRLLVSGAAGHVNGETGIEAAFATMQEQVAKLIRQLDGLYDVVIMDCPPGLSNVAWGAVQAANFVVVPYVPDATAEDNVGWLVNRIASLDPNKKVRLVANRMRTNNPFQRGIVDTIMARYPSLGLVMPQRAAIEGALEFRSPSQSLSQKFGDGRPIIEDLFNTTLAWIEESQAGGSA